MALPQRSFYEVIGVPVSATTSEIKKAYRQRAKVLHPDKHRDMTKEESENALDEIKLLNTAYKVLTSEETRKEYDLYGEEGLEEMDEMADEDDGIEITEGDEGEDQWTYERMKQLLQTLQRNVDANGSSPVSDELIDELTTQANCSYQPTSGPWGADEEAFAKEIEDVKSASVRHVEWRKHCITSLPSSFSPPLPPITEFSLADNLLDEFPSALTHLSASLRELNLSGNKIKKLDNCVCEFKRLKVLNLSRNYLSSLPKEFGRLESLQSLDLFGNLLTHKPSSLPDEAVLPLVSLRRVDLSANRGMKFIPSPFSRLAKRQKLDIEVYPPLPEAKPTLDTAKGETASTTKRRKITDEDKRANKKRTKRRKTVV